MSDVGDALAAVAIVVSLGSGVYARRAWLASDRQARAAEIQTRLATQQEAERQTARRRADVRAKLRPNGRGAVLVLHNAGAAEALDVRIGVSTHDPTEQAAADGAFHRVRPVRYLAPDTANEQPLITFDGMPGQYAIRVDWTNSDGTPGVWRSELSLG